ncbi:MAG: hypothetical protein ACTSRB_18325, partial [Candidatus Helarchaeota archaeon]
MNLCNKLPIKRTKSFFDFFQNVLKEHAVGIQKHEVLPAWYAFISQNAIDVLPTFAIPVGNKEAYEFGRQLWKDLILREVRTQGSIHY